EAEAFFAEEIRLAAVLQGLDKKLGVSIAVGLEVIDAAGGGGQIGRLRGVVPAADDLRFADAGGDKFGGDGCSLVGLRVVRPVGIAVTGASPVGARCFVHHSQFHLAVVTDPA